MAETKPNVRRVYLNDEDTQLMVSACSKTELGQAELLSKLVKAGLRALEANEYRMTLPFRLFVAGDSTPATAYRMNEPKKIK